MRLRRMKWMKGMKRMRWMMMSGILLMGSGAGYPIFSQNQSSKTAVISVSATVSQDIQILTVRDIDLAGVEPTGENLYISPILDPTAGMMIASGMPGAAVRMMFFREMELVRIDGPGRLRLTYEVSIFDEDNQRASRLFETLDEELRFNPMGKLYIWVGGSVDLRLANPGFYEGEFTIELEYI
ncbi:MAG: hypothetical protein M0P69_20240 [Bacteroidales bacterium]|nr:hypothetical protein [Bacteroidales bacterium]MDD2571447.1 hypothetical protein [Bacteroidales bacterium]MDD2813586.1 hypothetical protein [Bacteroidales bacterium]MDD3386303.1 hypothetical protein [Bacteroidales bacterium]